MTDTRVCVGEKINPTIKNDECVVFDLEKNIQRQARKAGITQEMVDKIRMETINVLITCWLGHTSVREIRCLVVPKEVAIKLNLEVAPTVRVTKADLRQYI